MMIIRCLRFLSVTLLITIHLSHILFLIVCYELDSESPSSADPLDMPTRQLVDTCEGVQYPLYGIGCDVRLIYATLYPLNFSRLILEIGRRTPIRIKSNVFLAVLQYEKSINWTAFAQGLEIIEFCLSCWSVVNSRFKRFEFWLIGEE